MYVCIEMRVSLDFVLFFKIMVDFEIKCQFICNRVGYDVMYYYDIGCNLMGFKVKIIFCYLKCRIQKYFRLVDKNSLFKIKM